MEYPAPGRCPSGIFLWILGLIALLPACSTESYRKAADEEALAILNEKQESVFGEKRPFKVEVPEDTPRTRLLEAIEKARNDPETEPEPLKLKLNLAGTLEVAAMCGRDFQNQKETLFLSALSLSTTRWEFDWQPSLTGSIGMDGNRRDTKASGSASFGLSKTLRTGASVLGSLLHTFSRTLTSGNRWEASSLLNIGLTQPLLRGFGAHIVMESLTQAERNVVYSLRSFERFRRRHVVSLTATYYGLLRQLDRIEIEKSNLNNLKVSLALQQALYEAGKRPKFQVDQNRQSVLRSETTLLSLQQRLRSSLDGFKITLGLPVETEILLDRDEFETLQKKGIETLEMTGAEALKLALEKRLDLKTASDQVEDARRQVVIAADNLRMGLDLDLSADVPTEKGGSVKPDWKNVSLGAGLSWDLPVDRTRQRNTYRSAIISYERAVRDHDLQLDSVKQEVRDGIRNLRQIEQDYEIQKQSVSLAMSQVDETREKMRAGRAIMRDLLEAQETLVNAQSSLSSRLVDYLTAKLELLRDVDILKLDPEGLKYDDRLDTYRSEEDSIKRK